MQKRAVRLALLALLVIVGLGASYLTWNIERRVDDLYAAERDVDARIDRVARHVMALGAAQQSAMVPGQPRADWLARGSGLLGEIRDEVTALGPRLRSFEAVTAFGTFGESLRGLEKTDARAREHLEAGQELMAADLVFAEGRQSIESMGAVLRELEVAERNAADRERRARQIEAGAMLGGAALVWLLGAVALVRLPARLPAPLAAPTAVPPEQQERPRPEPSPTRVNMTEAADVCTALSRLTSAAALPALLGRAAHVLDASGMIVWLGAGEELFPVTGHGYDARVLGRLGPIRRHADNATAAAWRSGAMQVVAGDMITNGAIAAPLFGPDGCIGVLAAEMRHGRETDETTQAVTTMVAAQLAAVVSAWPAPSAVEEPAPTASEGDDSSSPPAADTQGPTAVTADVRG